MFKFRMTLCILLILLFISGEISLSQNMVVTTNHIASDIGMEILQQGGNAIDAAVAAMFALSVVEPWSSGIGGGGVMMIKSKNDLQPIVISFREKAPLGALPKIFYNDEDDFNFITSTGYKSVCVPGMIAGAELALKKYGELSEKQVIEPVINLALNGFEVSEYFNKMLTDYYDLVEMNRTTSDIFLPDWLPLNAGDSLIRNDLAVTLEMLSLKGLNYFYNGDIAKDIVADFENGGGIFTIDDFNNYRAKQEKPVVGTYRGYQLFVPSYPNSGGLALIQLLNIIEEYNIQKMEFNSGNYIHIFLEALKYVLIDKKQYNDDSKLETFLSKKCAKSIKARIDTLGARKVEVLTSESESDNASHISIVDKDGNIVSLTQSINFYFGSGVTCAKNGVLFNNGLFHFSVDSLSANAISPGNVSANNMSPVIIFKNGQPFLILGSSGADRTISALAQIIIGIIDFNLDVQAAVSAPRFHYENGKVMLETRHDYEVIEYLKKVGHNVRLIPDYDKYFGIASVIKIDYEANELFGAIDGKKCDGKVSSDSLNNEK